MVDDSDKVDAADAVNNFNTAANADKVDNSGLAEGSSVSVIAKAVKNISTNNNADEVYNANTADNANIAGNTDTTNNEN